MVYIYIYILWYSLVYYMYPLHVSVLYWDSYRVGGVRDIAVRTRRLVLKITGAVAGYNTAPYIQGYRNGTLILGTSHVIMFRVQGLGLHFPQ